MKNGLVCSFSTCRSRDQCLFLDVENVECDSAPSQSTLVDLFPIPAHYDS